MQRDTLHSVAVFDLDAGPVTFTLPDTRQRLPSRLTVNQVHHALEVAYASAVRTLMREEVGTRTFAALRRTFLDPSDPKDVEATHAAQGGVRIAQAGPGSLEVPEWSATTHDRARAALLATRPGWNCVLRLGSPRPEILDDRWQVPQARPVG